MSAAEYHAVTSSFKQLEFDTWRRLHKLARLRLKRMKPETLAARLAAAILRGDRIVDGLWPALFEVPF